MLSLSTGQSNGAETSKRQAADAPAFDCNQGRIVTTALQYNANCRKSANGILRALGATAFARGLRAEAPAHDQAVIEFVSSMPSGYSSEVKRGAGIVGVP